jgi:phage host-nuclease inhibitor protein Gam
MNKRQSKQHVDGDSFVAGFAGGLDARKRDYWKKAEALKAEINSLNMDLTDLQEKVKKKTEELKIHERLGAIHETSARVTNHLKRGDLSRHQNDAVMNWLEKNAFKWDAKKRQYRKRVVYTNGRRTKKADCIEALQGSGFFKNPGSVAATWRRLSGGVSPSFEVVEIR